jgi:hypothetical protein
MFAVTSIKSSDPQYDVNADGSGFVAVLPSEDRASLTLLLNWPRLAAK